MTNLTIFSKILDKNYIFLGNTFAKNISGISQH